MELNIIEVVYCPDLEENMDVNDCLGCDYYVKRIDEYTIECRFDEQP